MVARQCAAFQRHANLVDAVRHLHRHSEDHKRCADGCSYQAGTQQPLPDHRPEVHRKDDGEDRQGEQRTTGMRQEAASDPTEEGGHGEDPHALRQAGETDHGEASRQHGRIAEG